MSSALEIAGLSVSYGKVAALTEVNLSIEAGEFVTLAELVEEVGPDAARFSFLMRSTSAHLDFDLAARTFAPMVCPAHVRISATMLAHGRYLYLVGGSARTAEGLTADRSIERFDPSTHTWSTVIAELPFDTHQARWAFVGERLVMLRTQETTSHATLAMIDVRAP